MNKELYRVVVVVPVNGVERYFDLDLCSQRTVQSDATIASYPVQNGVTVSDHMFRNPRTLSLSGAFSLNGAAVYEGTDSYDKTNLTETEGNMPWDEWFAAEGSGLKDFGSSNRLKSIQTFFEWIQEKGILCRVMMASANGAAPRFKVREKMALRSISWTERNNSMDFSFGFYEVIAVDNLFGSFEWFEYNKLYPSPVEPAARSLGEVLQDSGDIPAATLRALLDEGYIAKADGKAFVLKDMEGLEAVGRYLREIFKTILVASAAGAAAAAVIAVTSTIVAGSAATGPGVVIGIGVAVAVAIGFGIYSLVQDQKKRERLKRGFNLIMNYKQYVDPKTLEPTGKDIDKATYNDTDVKRLVQLLNKVAADVETIMSGVTVYQITDSETDREARQFPLPVGPDILYADIERSGGLSEAEIDKRIAEIKDDTAMSVGKKMSALVEVLGQEPQYTLKLFSGIGDNAKPVDTTMGTWPVCTRLNEMSRNSSVVYTTRDLQYECYLFNPSLDDTVNPDPLAQFQARRCLSNYYFLVCNGRMEENAKRLSKTITDAIDDYMKPAGK